MQSANTAPMGHNSPPSLEEQLREKHKQLLDRADELFLACDRVPQELTDDDMAGKAADLIKMITGAAKNLEAERVSEKEPFLIQGRQVDGFFKFAIDKLEAAKRKAKNPLETYLKKKEAEERRRLDQIAKEARQKAQDEAAAAAALARANMKPEAETLQDQAVISAAVANKAQAAAEVKPAALSQTRSSTGALASLRTWWVGEMIDQKALDLEKLRHHLSPDALQKAINSFVGSGGRELAGARIMEKSESVVR